MGRDAASQPPAQEAIATCVVGTAGHIDHGKSSLVRALTGRDPDRLKEEQDRGLTIDLGFAPLVLPDGRTVGMIDVPGHERFVKNMVAGATGIDVVLLVVAADDGVMPQTREHLEILGLLGIRQGIVAVSKIDLPGVDQDLLDLLEEELRELLRGTFLADAPFVRVSSVTGQGLDRLREELERAIGRAEPRPSGGAFRMPVQRVFSAQGFGTILTGVPLEGTLSVGDPVEVLTADGKAHKGKVRGLQAYGRKVEQVRAGHSSALNVTDVDRRAVQRGDAVCTPGVFAQADMFEVRLTYLSSQPRPLRPRETVRFHVGTSEVLGEVVLLEHKQLEPGQSGLCQVRLRHPVVAGAGDRFVLRLHSPMVTIGGGTIIGASRWRLKPFKEFVLERLEQKERVLGAAEETLLLELEESRDPARVDELVPRLKRPRKELAEQLEALRREGRVVEVSAGKGQPAFVTSQRFERAREQLLARLGEFHAAHPVRQSVPRAELRSSTGLPEGLFLSALEQLQAEGQVRTDGEARPEARGVGRGFALASHAPTWSEPAAAYRDALTALFQERAFQTPTREQAEAELAPPLEPGETQDVFQALLEQGDLVLVGEEGLVFHRQRYEAAQELVRREIKARGSLTAGAFKDLLDSSRRYAIPLMEHFDEIGLTRREGDARVLREA